MHSENFHSPEELQEWGRRFAGSLSKGSVVALSGDLGAGKTTLVQGIAGGINGANPSHVCSPTFTFLHIYQGDLPLYHFDLYRLPSSSEFVAAGFDEYLDSDGITCIEWPEKIHSLLPRTTWILHLSHVQEGQRKLTVSHG